MTSFNNALTKSYITRQFSAIAANYENHAFLHQEIAARMIKRLTWQPFVPTKILALGCGTGYELQLLEKQFESSNIIGVDIAHGMLSQHKLDNLICADAISLPIKKHSVDLIFANLLLPWCDDLPALFAECRRVLSPDGVLIFSTFGPDTFKEIQRIPHFIDMHHLGDFLLEMQFVNPVMDVEHIIMEYQQPKQLFDELMFQGLALFLDDPSFRHENITQLTHEVIYGTACASSVMQEENGRVSIPVNKIRINK